jgi:hypothetical protein
LIGIALVLLMFVGTYLYAIRTDPYRFSERWAVSRKEGCGLDSSAVPDRPGLGKSQGHHPRQYRARALTRDPRAFARPTHHNGEAPPANFHVWHFPHGVESF